MHGSATRREIGALFVVFAVRVTSASHGYDVAVSGRYLSLDECERAALIIRIIKPYYMM